MRISINILLIFSGFGLGRAMWMHEWPMILAQATICLLGMRIKELTT